MPGDQLPQFMSKAVRESDFVLIVCTPNYKSKSDSGNGGVGYEGDIMTGEVLTEQNHRKFIPILREGAWSSAAPSWVAGKYYVKLTGQPYSKEAYCDLLKTLHGKRATAPPIGRAPSFAADKQDLLAIGNDILTLANEILQTNQDALVSLIRNPVRRYSVGRDLTALYQQQRHRARFSEWKAFLAELADSTSDPFERSVCEGLLEAINDLCTAFYTYERSVDDKGEFETTKHFVELVLGDRGSDPRWYQLDGSEVRRIAERYLENLRRSVDLLGSVVGTLRARR